MLWPRHCVLAVLFASVAVSPALPSQVSRKREEATVGKTSTRTTEKCKSDQAIPDPACTPGAVLTTDLTVICRSGYTKTVRDVPVSVKKRVFEQYGIPWERRGDYEVDHLISLELGGSNEIANLWPESSLISNGSKVKDKFENYLHAQTCGGRMGIEEAQREIATNWLDYYVATQASPPPTTPIRQQSQSRGSAPSPAKLTEPDVKKSSTGICHAKGTPYYARTAVFTPYGSIQDCLGSGGRLPAQ